MRLDQVQIAIPIGGEAEARAYSGDLIGLGKIRKPPPFAGRGGCGFKLGQSVLDLGIDPDFTPQPKAHVALAVPDLASVRTLVAQTGRESCEAQPFDERPSVFTTGNRLEFIED